MEAIGKKDDVGYIMGDAIQSIVDNLFNTDGNNHFDINNIKIDTKLPSEKFLYFENSYQSIPFFAPESPIVESTKISKYFTIDETKTRMETKRLLGLGYSYEKIKQIKESVALKHIENEKNNRGLPDFFPYVWINQEKIPPVKITEFNNNTKIYTISTILTRNTEPIMNMVFIQNCITHLMGNIILTTQSVISYAFVTEGIRLYLFISIVSN